VGPSTLCANSYISRAIEAGMPLNVVAENCGTSVRMIETTYAKVLAGKRREFIARGAPRLFANAAVSPLDIGDAPHPLLIAGS